VVVSETDLVAAVTRDRAAGKRIGFAILSFELLRVGELRLLQAAAGRADRLVVAVVDDGSRRVVKAADRAELVDNVRGVHYVIVCGRDRVEPLAALLMPDVRA
jgi:bifunctional ADP-heptose synthase (sugar kinase/adenylyltransferase)